MTDFENSQDRKDQPSAPEGAEIAKEEAKKRIQKMVQTSPHDFIGFDISELKDEDFEIEEKYSSKGGLSFEEIQSRNAGLDIDKPLNKSQKMLNAHIINQLMVKFRDVR